MFSALGHKFVQILGIIGLLWYLIGIAWLKLLFLKMPHQGSERIYVLICRISIILFCPTTHSLLFCWEISSLGLKDTTLITVLGFFRSFPRARKILKIGSRRPAVMSSVQSCPTPCDPMDCRTPGLPVHHPEFTQTHVHRVRDAIQPSHPLSSPSPPASNLFQHQGLL